MKSSITPKQIQRFAAAWTGVEDIRWDLKNAGFIVEDKPDVYDESQRLITSPNPKTEVLKAFCEEIGKQAHRLLL